MLSLSLACFGQEKEKAAKPYHTVSFKGIEFNFTKVEVDNCIKELSDNMDKMNHLKYRERKKALSGIMSKANSSILEFNKLNSYEEIINSNFEQKKIFLILDVVISHYKDRIKSKDIEWKINCTKVLRHIINSLLKENAEILARARTEGVDEILDRFFKDFQREVLKEVILER
jgi:hypothetical protein